MERWKERKKEREGGGGWRNDPWIERVAILTWLHFRYDYYCAISGRVHGRTGRTRTNFQRERMKIDFHVSPNHPPFPLLSSFRTNAHRYVCQISIRNIDARSKILNLPVLVFLFFFFPFFSLLLSLFRRMIFHRLICVWYILEGDLGDPYDTSLKNSVFDTM